MKYLYLFFILTTLNGLSQKKLSDSKVRSLEAAPQKREDGIIKHSNLLNFVNPFIGTGGHGHTYPGASAPFGMMQLSPDTRYKGWDGCSGYHYSDSIIWGFSHTHLSGTGVEDYCDLLVVPQVGKEIYTTAGYLKEKEGYGASFSHRNEHASPGYYSVTLDNGIKAELTTSKRAGIHRYSFPDNKLPRAILIDLTHRDELLKYFINEISPVEFEGFRMSSSWAENQFLYFNLRLDVKPIKSSIIEDGTKLLLEFDPKITEVELRVGISAVDEKGASTNSESELMDISFNAIKKRTENEWTRELSSIIVDTTNINEATKFYTALYHSYLAPTIFNDVDGRYRGLDKEIHQLNIEDRKGYKDAQYTVFSLWDTYRATHPLFTLTQKERTLQFIKSFENHFLHSGDLPVWELAGNETNCMIGYHSVSVIADAYIKGIKQIDVPLFINALQTTANIDEFGKKQFNENGFIGYKDEPESVSKTLEYAYDSYCIYQFLKEVKKDGFDVEQSLIDEYYNRSFNFINIFNPQTGFMQPRNGGIWYTPFKPEEVNFNFTEANSWQYSLYAPQAIPLLAELLGGKDALEKWLDNLFSTSSITTGNKQADITGLIGQYAHGNEPSHHMAYLYNYTNSPEKTAVIVDSIMRYYYHNEPDGLSGNEDCGQMSSWYVLSSMGLYPVCPGSGIYDFGRPLFNEVFIHLESGKAVRISVKNNSTTNKFIQSIQVDGKPFNKRFITQKELENCKKLEFTMGPYPSQEYRKYKEAPSINSMPNEFVPVPYFDNETTSFEKQLKIKINGIIDGLEFYYTLDGSVPTNKSKRYKKPIVIKKNSTINVIAYNPKTGFYSKPISNKFNLKPQGIALQLNTKYFEQYSASGDESLIDGLYGSDDFRSGDWQGFYNTDVDAKVTFTKSKLLTKIGLSALQNTGSWIFPPKSVVFTIQYDDLTTEALTTEFKDQLSAENCPKKAIKYEVKPQNKPIKSIEFKAINYGPNPDWHKSPNYPTFIFLDEFYFE